MMALLAVSTVAVVLAMRGDQPEAAPLPNAVDLDETTGPIRVRVPSMSTGLVPEPGYQTGVQSEINPLGEEFAIIDRDLNAPTVSPYEPRYLTRLRRLQEFIFKLSRLQRDRQSQGQKLTDTEASFLQNAQDIARRGRHAYAYARLDLGLPPDPRDVQWTGWTAGAAPRRDAHGFYILFDGQGTYGLELGKGFALDEHTQSLLVRNGLAGPARRKSEDAPDAPPEDPLPAAPEAVNPKSKLRPDKGAGKGPPKVPPAAGGKPDDKAASPDAPPPEGEKAPPPKPPQRSPARPRPGLLPPNDALWELPAANPSAARFRVAAKEPIENFEICWTQEWHVGFWPRAGWWFHMPAPKPPSSKAGANPPRFEKLLVSPEGQRALLVFDDDRWDAPAPPISEQKFSPLREDGSHFARRVNVQLLVSGRERRLFVNGYPVDLSSHRPAAVNPGGGLEFVVSAKGPVDFRITADFEWTPRSAARAREAGVPEAIVAQISQIWTNRYLERWAIEKLITDLPSATTAVEHTQAILSAAELAGGIRLMVYPTNKSR